jgi:predicted amidophosphoribosyltransferase
MNGEEEHAKANARLISLAPEMAEFLADLVIPVPADAAWTIDFDHARALLRRARGEDA